MVSGLIDKAKNYVAQKIADMKKPEASLSGISLKGINRECITYNAKVAVKNPYGFSVPVCEIHYNLKSAGREMASGSMPDPGSLKGNAITNLDVSMKVPHNVLVSLVRDIGSDWDIDYELQVKLIIDIPVFGNFILPLSAKGEFKLPTLSDLLSK
ncbi:Late embryogenesis abundant protein, LEA_2 subgroup [Dillenia turbinata]|uniref:Late embryogenesis abundant protein, LEA_2 subgroup n=1 Tax=Dillenia turbinata TaxID=194707 RepID=A0AAN8VHI1_9MAGN